MLRCNIGFGMMPQFDAVQIHSLFDRGRDMATDAVEVRSKHEQDGRFVLGSLVKRSQFLEVRLNGTTFIRRRRRTRSPDFYDNEIPIHATRSVHEQIWLCQIEVATANEGMSVLVDFTAERVPPGQQHRKR